MEREMAQNWCEALRSGKYEQTNGTLTACGKFCCLGVLDDLYPELNLAGKNENSLGNHIKAGLKTGLGHLPSGGVLAYMNDSGSTFNEIADVIEAEYCPIEAS